MRLLRKWMMLAAACVIWLFVLGGWIALAGRTVETKIIFVLALQFLMGLLAALGSMTSNRLAMAIIPVMGRNHFFALYSVIGNVTLGLAPIGWGVLIDSIGTHSVTWLHLEWNRFTIFFTAAALVFLLTFFLARKLDEPEAASMEDLLREFLVQSPQKFWLRFWPRG